MILAYYVCVYFVLLLVNSIYGGSKEELDMCLNIYDVSNRTIIKATASVQKGGRYLDSIELNTRLDCKVACCNRATCNIAVFQENKDKTCYLFDCGTMEDFKCIFAVHDNYVSMGMMVDRRELETAKIHEQSKHEMDLNMISANEQKSRKVDPPPVANPSENNYDRQKYRERPQEQNSYNQPAPEYNRPPAYQQNNNYQNHDYSNPNAYRRPSKVMDKDISKPKSPFEGKVHQSSSKVNYDHEIKNQQPPSPLQQQQQRKPPAYKQPQQAQTIAQNSQKLVAPAASSGNLGQSHVEPLFAPKTDHLETEAVVGKTAVGGGEEEGGGVSLAGLILGLGISLLAVFMVFVSYRLRNARRKMRKGRLLDTGEGELLINGMYL